MPLKQGRVSKDELKFIEDNLKDMTYIEIATHLNRSTEIIRRLIEERGFDTSLKVKDRRVSQSFKLRPFYGELRSQFTEEELEFFEREYLAIEEQFDREILPTEQGQLLDLIKISILMNRCLKTHKECQDTIEENKKVIEREKKKKGDRVPQLMEVLIQENTGLVQALARTMDEFRQFDARKEKLLNALKASRAHRITEVEKRSETFAALLKSLIVDKEWCQECGIEAEKMRLASIDEEIRLSAYLRYEDGKVDQPLLTVDTVKDDNTP